MENNVKKTYLLLDVGGTQVKASTSDEAGNIRDKIFSYPACAQEDEQTVMENFAFILRELMKLDSEAAVAGVGMAFPGPFDYENGISLMKGLNKYDSIYGKPIEAELKRRIPALKNTAFCFLHDVEAFALGESWFGEAQNEKRLMCLCIGTGAGSAFLENRIPLKEEKEGVPKNGWLYCFPYKDSIIDDYISVRGLAGISRELTGHVRSGKELSELCKKKNAEAYKVWEAFGKDLKASITPFLDSFRPDAVVIGGQISKSFSYFGQDFAKECGCRKIKVYAEPETSVRAMQGLFIKITRGE